MQLRRFLLSILLSCLAVQAEKQASATELIDFARQIAPIFQDHCVKCHSPGISKGEFSIDTLTHLLESGYVVPGDAEGSYLLELVTSQHGEPPRMPQKAEPLSVEQVTLLQHWIAQGANWPAEFVIREKSQADASWWSLQPLSSVVPPELPADSEWSNHPIDRFILARLQEKQLSPSPPAPPQILLRRLKYDLHGLPPSPAELRQWGENPDPSPAAYGQMIDQFLASPHYGERMAQHWLDLAHYADTHGFERDQLREHAWHYRDYVIRAFNSDKPYDLFLREQIAGDILNPDDSDSVIATGFLAAGPWDYVGQVEARSPVLNRAARALDLDDMVTQVMTATIAMTVNCARCHDHKLDPISQDEYYRLCAVFAGLKRGNRAVNESALQDWQQNKAQLEQRLAHVQAQLKILQGAPVDLADLVGGGDGFGSGKVGRGINLSTGFPQQAALYQLQDTTAGKYLPVDHSGIDGVFVPANSQTQISSTGLHFNRLPRNSGNAWDAIRHGPVTSQFSTQFGKVDYQSAGHSFLGLHANSGITFDLKEIAERLKGTLHQFSTVVGYGGQPEEPSAEFWVLLDGKLIQQGKVGRNSAVSVVIDLSIDHRFLTLISTDGGNGYGHDQVSFGDPYLHIQTAGSKASQFEQQRTDLLAEQQRLNTELQQQQPPPEFFGVTTETPPVVHVLRRGDPESPDHSVAPGTLGWGRQEIVFGENDLSDAERRVALADWITAPENPLTARVIVNRLWQWHFGRGLVDTPSDFGFGGARPTHPELLDWLAAELIRENWNLKHIQRLILTSHTYRMTSQIVPQTSLHAKKSSADPQVIDTDNRLLWRMNGRRLEAEVIRDAVLQVSGRINLQMYGPGYRDFDYQEAYAPIYKYNTADSPELWRRSIYRFVVRTTPHPFLTTFDCPDPATLTAKRNITTTPLQALALYNNDFILRCARDFAQRLEREAGTDIERQIQLAFTLALGRPAGQEEVVLSRECIATAGLFAFCRSLFNANEFLYVD